MFLAMATLVRTNFAYVAVTVLLGSALIPNNQDKYARSTRMPAIIFGGASVLIITILPYALTGQLPLFYKSAVLIPLDYSNGGLSYFEVAKAMLDNAVSAGTGAIFRAYQFSLWIGGLSGLLSLFASPICRRKPLAAIWISTFLAATLASILSAGHPWGHYLLQLVPFFAIGVGLLASAIFSFRPIRQMSIAPIHVAIIVSLLIMSRYTIADAIGRLKDHGMNEYGPSYAVAEQLKYKLKPTDTLFITHDILTYWILQKTPLVPIAIFPLNIFVDSITKHLYGFSVTSEDVLEQIMDRNPTVIVVPKNSQFQTSKVFINKLSRNYILYKELTVPAFRSWRPFLSDQDRLIFWNKRASIVSAYK
jgi:hypothetical protein